jgi:hypothetical protein
MKRLAMIGHRLMAFYGGVGLAGKKTDNMATAGDWGSCPGVRPLEGTDLKVRPRLVEKLAGIVSATLPFYG